MIASRFLTIAVFGLLASCAPYNTYPGVEHISSRHDIGYEPMSTLVVESLRYADESYGVNEELIINLPEGTPASIYDDIIDRLGRGRPMIDSSESALHIKEVRSRGFQGEVDVIYPTGRGQYSLATIFFDRGLINDYAVINARRWRIPTPQPTPSYPAALRYQRIEEGLEMPEGETATAKAAASKPPHFASVKIAGATASRAEPAQYVIKAKAGQPFDQDLVDRDIAALTMLGVYANVDWSTSTRPDGSIDLVYQLTETPVIKQIIIVGNTTITDRELTNLLAAQPGDIRDDDAIEEGRQRIILLYQERGLDGTDVGIDQDMLEDEWMLVYRVTESQEMAATASDQP